MKYSKTSFIHRPRLSFLQIWNMNFGFLGIQFGFALQNANVSRIFQTLGAPIDKIPILWIAAPLTGLLVQPIIGYLSDRSWHPFWGRRRPFFFAGAVLSAIAMFLMPNSVALWMAVIVLWLMDASINISMEPFRAFVGDRLPAAQHTMGFAMQTFFIGIGAVVGSQLPYMLTHWLHIRNTAPTGEIPPSVKCAFYIGGIVFMGAVAWTVFTSKEDPPEDIRQWKEEKRKSKGLLKAVSLIAKGIFNMPPTMVQLAAVQFFTWVAFFALWIYTSPAVAESIYHTTDPSSKAFQDAGDWVGVLFAVYNGVSMVAAFLLPLLAKYIRRTRTHLLCLIIGGLGFVSFVFIRDPVMLILPMIAIGLAWSSTLTMPYAILAGALPAEKMGFYMGVFNFFIVIPQIIAASLLGFLVRHFFHSHSIYALALGGACMIVAGLLNFIVKDARDPLVRKPVV